MRWAIQIAYAREVAHRIRYLVFRRRYTAELEEEMRLHLALREQRLRERGAEPLEAYYAARRRFGNRGNLQQRSRDMWGFSWLGEAGADVRFAARRLRRRPGFAVSTILVAALGIGATTAVFSAIDAAFIRPLPFARPNELVTLTNVDIPLEQSELPPGMQHSGPHHLDIMDARRMTDLFAGAGAFAAGGLNLNDQTNPRRVRVGVVTAHFFSLLGVRPERGREFSDDEGRPNGANSVILSDAFWHDAYGGADMLDKSIELNGNEYTVVGVMPAGFTFPNESELWIPLPVPVTFATFSPFRGYLPSVTFARLARGVSLDAARDQLLSRWRQLSGPDGPAGTTNFENSLKDVRAKGAVRPLKQVLVGNTRTTFAILMGAALLLMLIACANVANLLVSDAASRRREIALRGLLGAAPGRMVRQLLAESLLLALSGSILGLTFAPAALHVLRAMMPSNLAGVAPAQLDLRVLAFAAALALVTGMVFGLWPALAAAHADAAETIKSGGGGATASGGGIRRVLITTELALTVMLLVGSGLMLRSLERVLGQRTGMDPEHIGTLELSMSGHRSRAVELTTVHGILARLEADPGIASAGVVNDLPLRGQGGISISITVDGQPAPTSVNDMKMARYLMASGGYFKTMGISLLRGRTFTASDDSLAPPVAVISETMAKTYWPNTDPIGKTFHSVEKNAITVVGVVADVRERSLEGDPSPQMYFPIDRNSPQNLAVVVRGSHGAAMLLSRLRDAVRAVDPRQAVYNVRTMDDVISTSVTPRRTNTTLIAIFGGVALVLAAFGVYAVVSYSVTRRAREFGIRAALGATGRNIATLVGREMAWMLAIGLALGLAGAWALSRLLSSLLYGVDAHDFATFAAAPLLLVIPAAIATLVPARRAMRVDPTEVLRAE